MHVIKITSPDTVDIVISAKDEASGQIEQVTRVVSDAAREINERLYWHRHPWKRRFRNAKTYRPWKGFTLIGLGIALPLVFGVPRYWASWIAFAGFVIVVAWSIYLPGYSDEHEKGGN